MGSERTPRVRGWYLLLIIPFIATLWVPFYNSLEPVFAGIPYFYWYQFAWVFISAVITAIVYADHTAPLDYTARSLEPSAAS